MSVTETHGPAWLRDTAQHQGPNPPSGIISCWHAFVTQAE